MDEESWSLEDAAQRARMAPDLFYYYARPLGLGHFDSHRRSARGQRQLFYTAAEIARVTAARIQGRKNTITQRAHGQAAQKCGICGAPLATHPRCPRCSILMGDGHPEQGGGPLCVGCRPRHIGFELPDTQRPACRQVGRLTFRRGAGSEA